MSCNNKEQPKLAGPDLGDKYSYLRVTDNNSGEAIEEGRLLTTPKPSSSARLETGELIKVLQNFDLVFAIERPEPGATEYLCTVEEFDQCCGESGRPPAFRGHLSSLC
jgi:hypothetical protein